MEKVINKGDSFIAAEISRLDRLLGMDVCYCGGEGWGGFDLFSVTINHLFQALESCAALSF